LSGEIPEAVAMKPAVLTCAPLRKVIPSWFSRITWPLALICPAICDGLGPVTRFSATAAAFGCWKSTDCRAPTLKLCQSIAARWLDWVMVVALAERAMLAAPPTTTPPCGAAFGESCARAGCASTSTTVACNAVVSSSARRLRRSTPASRNAAPRVGRTVRFGVACSLRIRTAPLPASRRPSRAAPKSPPRCQLHRDQPVEEAQHLGAGRAHVARQIHARTIHARTMRPLVTRKRSVPWCRLG
jgi:hypothetical protein